MYKTTDVKRMTSRKRRRSKTLRIPTCSGWGRTARGVERNCRRRLLVNVRSTEVATRPLASAVLGAGVTVGWGGDSGSPFFAGRSGERVARGGKLDLRRGRFRVM